MAAKVRSLCLPALLAAAVLLLALSPARQASATAARLALPEATCSAASAGVSFSWQPVAGSFDQWLDLSLADNGFAPGTFSTSGALSSSQSSYTWAGLVPGAVYYWRVNARMDGGWATSMTGAFVPCRDPVLLWGPLSCQGTEAASVDVRWAPMATNAGPQYVDIGSDPAFSPGSFASSGALAAAAQTFTWDNLQAGAPYVFRVNTFGSDGAWHASQLGGFIADCAAAPAVNLDLHGSNDTFVYSRLNIEAPVNVRNVGPDGALGNPDGPWDVVRYDFPLFEGYGGYPGNGGTVVIAGHVDYHPNLMAVFWELRGARPGDVIDYYRGDGVHVQYSVDWAQQIGQDFDMNALTADNGSERLVLITCDGTFNPATREYDLRFAVQAHLIG